MHHYQSCLVSGATLMMMACSTTLIPELQQAKEAHKPIFVGHLSSKKAKERGIIDVSTQFFNTSNKTYKYVDLHITATNRVGDLIVRDGDVSPTVRLQFTGPLPPRRTPGITTWPNVWYLQKPFCLTILKIDITHMDGSAVRLDGAALESVLANKLRRGCRVRIGALRG